MQPGRKNKIGCVDPPHLPLPPPHYCYSSASFHEGLPCPKVVLLKALDLAVLLLLLLLSIAFGTATIMMASTWEEMMRWKTTLTTRSMDATSSCASSGWTTERGSYPRNVNCSAGVFRVRRLRSKRRGPWEPG